MPTTFDLDALPYAINPFSKGILVDDLQGALFGPHGTVFRWWKAFPTPTERSTGATPWSGPNGEAPERNGQLYIEQTQTLDGRPLSEARCLLYHTERDADGGRELGTIPQGSTGIAVLPYEAEFARLDRVLFPSVTWLARGLLRRGAGATDALAYPYASQLVAVRTASGTRPASDYELAPEGANGASSVRWLHNAPASGEAYAVEFRYAPLFEWLTHDQGVVQRGADDQALSQRGVIRLMSAR